MPVRYPSPSVLNQGAGGNFPTPPPSPAGPGWGGALGVAGSTLRRVLADGIDSGVDLLVTGDSVAVGWFADSAYHRWVNVMAATLNNAIGLPAPAGYAAAGPATQSGYTDLLWVNGASGLNRVFEGLGYSSIFIADGESADSPTVLCDRVWVMYPEAPTSFGAFQVRIDGVLVDTVNPVTGGTVLGGRVWDSGPLDLGEHTVAITPTTAFGSVIEGASFFNGNGRTPGGTGPGFRVWQNAHFGYKLANYIDPAPGPKGIHWWDGLDSIAPAAHFVLCQLNDELTATPTEFYEHHVTLWEETNAGLASLGVTAIPSHFIVGMYDRSTVDPVTSAAFRGAAMRAADDLGGFYIDWWEIFGDLSSATTDPNGWSPDNVHLGTAGHAVAGGIMAGIVQQASPAVALLPGAADRPPVRRVFMDTTPADSTGANDNLMTYTIPAGTLANDGDSIELSAAGTFANNANAKATGLIFIIVPTALVVDPGTAGVELAWVLQATITRVDAATVKWEGIAIVAPVNPPGTVAIDTTDSGAGVGSTAGVDWTVDIVINLASAGVAAADVTAQMMTATFLAAP